MFAISVDFQSFFRAVTPVHGYQNEYMACENIPLQLSQKVLLLDSECKQSVVLSLPVKGNGQSVIFTCT